MADLPEGFVPDTPVGFEPDQTEPPITLSPYEKARLQGIGPGIAATTGPANPEEIIPSYLALNQPAISLPRLKPSSTLGKIAAAPVNLGESLLEGVTSPVGALTLPLFSTRLGRVGMGALGVGGGLQNIYEGVKNLDVEQGTRGALETLLGGYIAKTGLPLKTPEGFIPETPREAPILPKITKAPEVAEAPPVESEVPKETPPSTVIQGAPQPAPSEVAAETVGVSPPPVEPAIAQRSVTPTVTQVPETGVKTPEAATVGGGGAAEAGEIPDIGESGDIYGIAQRVREQRAKAGVTVNIQPGQGVSAVDAVAHGLDVLDKDPLSAQKAVDAFNKDKSISYDGVSAARAKGEKAWFDARRTEEKLGTDSPEYQTAKAAAEEWDKASKPMQTEWSKIGQAQQGHTDIDTSSFTGLSRAWHDATGKDFSPEQVEPAKKRAKAVKDAGTEVEGAKQNVSTELDKEFARQKAVTDAEQGALDAASKTVRENAIRIAELENTLRIAKTEGKAGTSDIQVKAAQKALDTAQKVAREAATKQAELERKLQSNPQKRVWDAAKKYIERGMDDLHDVRNKVATDLGMTTEQVARQLAYTPRLKYVTDDLFLKQAKLRELKQGAKNWLKDQEVPGYLRALNKVPRFMFATKVGLHGYVPLGTHAPSVAFQPPYWATYFKAYGTMFKMIHNRAFFKQTMEDLVRRPNYITARRANLYNDPNSVGDFDNPAMSQYMGKFTQMGNRGYAILKVLRQDMFDLRWNALPKTLQIPEVAKAVAADVNHATGIVEANPFKSAHLVFFAPKLEMSRVAWLVGDPLKAAHTFINWKDASFGDREFAISQIKGKAWVMGTLSSLLAMNQGILTATGSDQKVNISDPFKSDWLKFKIAGMNVSYGSPLVTMARFPLRVGSMALAPQSKLQKLTYPDETFGGELFKYARSQMSPFAGTLWDLITQMDYARRPLPLSSRPVPKRLAAQGVEPYTWTEYLTRTFMPIPMEEAVKEVWKNGMGMNDEEIAQTMKSFVTLMFMSLTGGRMTEDYELESTQTTQ